MPNTFSTIYGDAPAFVRKAWWTGRMVGTGYLRADHQRTINDTRGVVDYDLAIGDIVQFDPFSTIPGTAQVSAANASTQAGQDAAVGFGPCVGAPNIGSAYRSASASAAVTSIGANIVAAPADIIDGQIAIQPRLYVVTHVHPDVNRLSNSSHSNTRFARQRDGGWIDIAPMGVVEALFYKNTLDAPNDVELPMGTLLALRQPATTSATNSVYCYGSQTSNSSYSKPALANLLDADLDRTTTTATTSFRNIVDALSRINAVLAETVKTVADGGPAYQTYSLRRVAIGGGLWDFGV